MFDTLQSAVNEQQSQQLLSGWPIALLGQRFERNNIISGSDPR